MLEDEEALLEDKVLLLDCGDTLVEDVAVLADVVVELEVENVLPEAGDLKLVLELPEGEEVELLEDRGLGRRLLLRGALVVEVDVPLIVDDVVPPEAEELDSLVVLVVDMVLPESEDVDPLVGEANTPLLVEEELVDPTDGEDDMPPPLLLLLLEEELVDRTIEEELADPMAEEEVVDPIAEEEGAET